MNSDRNNNFSFNVSVELSKDYINIGRNLYTEVFYTSLELAKYLIDFNTNLTGTIRSNRKNLPKEVVSRKIRRKDIIGIYLLNIGFENEDVLVISK